MILYKNTYGIWLAWLIALLAIAGPVYSQEEKKDEPEFDPADLARPVDIRLPTEFDPEVFNVARFDFDTFAAGTRNSDLGQANLMPIGIEEESDSFGPGRKVFIFRNRRPFLLREFQSVTFRVLVGNTTELYIWPEAGNGQAEWSVRVRQLNSAGLDEFLLLSSIESQEFIFFSVVPHSEIEVTVSVRNTTATLVRSLWLTLSPELFNTAGPSKIIERPSRYIPLR